MASLEGIQHDGCQHRVLMRGSLSVASGGSSCLVLASPAEVVAEVFQLHALQKCYRDWCLPPWTGSCVAQQQPAQTRWEGKASWASCPEIPLLNQGFTMAHHQ